MAVVSSSRSFRLSPIMGLAVALAAFGAAPSLLLADTYKPNEYLASVDQPNFHTGHTLPRLTRWGWNVSYDTTVELTENWGYALEIAGYLTQAKVDEIRNNPSSRNARLVNLTLSDPERYPLSVITHRPLTNVNAMPADLRDDYYVRDADGNQVVDPSTGGPSWRTVSPEMPDAIYDWAAQGQAAPLADLRSIVPISVILNGGEYGLNVYGHSGSYWAQDPDVVAARGAQSWYDYASARKGHYEQIISDAAFDAVPDRDLYVFYYTNGAQDRNAYGSWWQWVSDYGDMRNVSDMPNSSVYFKEFNTGWTGSRDMLSQVTNSVAQEMQYGDGLSYNWVNAGWRNDDFSSMEHYTGFLKSYYAAGMTGGVAGYFSYPPGGFDADLTGDAPHWLTQMEVLGRVHATFSYLEKYLRNGDLLPGPDMHRWSTDLPAYELPTGDANARVLARKLKDRDEWLVTAWAADGPDRVVTVHIDGLGDVDVLARDAGSIYLVTLTDQGVSQKLVDPDAMKPSAALNMVTASIDPFGVLDLPGDNVVLDGETFAVRFTLDEGYQLTELLVDGSPVILPEDDTFIMEGVTRSHTLHFGVTQIPEPASLTLLAIGAMVIARRPRARAIR